MSENKEVRQDEVLAVEEEDIQVAEAVAEVAENTEAEQEAVSLDLADEDEDAAVEAPAREGAAPEAEASEAPEDAAEDTGEARLPRPRKRLSPKPKRPAGDKEEDEFKGGKMQNQRLPNPEQIAITMTCKAMSERAKKALKASEAISRMSREFSCSCDAAAKMDPSEGYSLYELRELEKEISSYFDNLLIQAHELYEVLSGPADIDFPDWKTSPKDFPSNKVERDFGVRAFVSDGCLFVKMPLLPHSINAKKRVANNGKFHEFSYLFTYELQEKLMEIFDEIPPLSQKTITYLFVRQEGSGPAIDCDNVDTKAVTDTICMYFRGGDSAATTSFRLAAVFDNRLPKGTYICVSEGRLSCPDPELILEKFLP